jgi:hypothetical protein
MSDTPGQWLLVPWLAYGGATSTAPAATVPGTGRAPGPVIAFRGNRSHYTGKLEVERCQTE